MDLSNFKILDIKERDIYNFSNKCCFCEKNVFRVSIFDKCKHYCCLECLDSLYDFYKVKDNEDIMFLCPYCREKVKDVIYKDL